MTTTIDKAGRVTIPAPVREHPGRLPAGPRLESRHAGQSVKEKVLARFTVRDAHLPEPARLAGAEVVVTENRRHFVPLMRCGIRVLTTAEFAEEYRALTPGLKPRGSIAEGAEP